MSFPAVYIVVTNWNGNSVLVTEPIEQYCLEDALTDLHVRLLEEIARVSVVKEPYTASSFFTNLNTRLDFITEYSPEYQIDLIRTAVDLLAHTLDGVELPWVWRMGDFVPWNLGADSSRKKLTVVDLEYAASNSIPGWDIFHFCAAAGNRNSGNNDWASMFKQPEITRYFGGLGVDSGVIPQLFLAYVVDLWILWAEMWKRYGRMQPFGTAKLFREKANLTASLVFDWKKNRLH
jgi:hypothetical protein